MPRFQKEEDWRPVGVDDLESVAEVVVRSQDNTLVVAGPGAGKTELLAQRANFLLETGRCPTPFRILAISFKRDAAKNLETRVKERCAGKADRFDSFTLDAFAKGLVDRFLPAIPEEWRPKPGYLVRTAAIAAPAAQDWLLGAPIPAGFERPNVHGWSRSKLKRVLDEIMHGEELPYGAPDLHEIRRAWGIHWWREQLCLPADVPSLTFPMLNRLAAYSLRCNPKIVAALHSTYAYVFLDEFQDTTSSQWGADAE